MALINPITLKKRLQKAQDQVPYFVKEALEKSNLEKINIDNLQQGKDSEGNNMPSYRNPDYANFKTSINPRNRGFWDLRLTGEYYSGIRVKAFATQVFFSQVVKNDKIDWLTSQLEFWNKTPLGVTKEQIEDVQLKNAPGIKKRIENILNNG